MVSTQAAVFEVVVASSCIEETPAVLKRAMELAGHLGVRITILVPQVVPYPLPLNRPPVSLDWLRRRFAAIIRDQTRDQTRDQAIETRVVIGLCRDRELFLERALQPESTIVMRKSRLARRLSSLGHNVLIL
jgi:hypothetical protein